MSSPKIYDLSGTNAGKDLLFVITCSGLELLDFQNFEEGLIFCSIVRSFYYSMYEKKQ